MVSLAAAAGLAVATGGLLAAWGVLVEPRLLEKRAITAWLPNLPAAWDGQRLALLGDLQVGAPLANVDTVRRAVDTIVVSRPAAVLLAGDYAYHLAADPSAIAAQVRDLLRPLAAAGIPTFGVFGNHDFAVEGTDDPRRQQELGGLVATALHHAGVRILRNAAVPIPSPDGATGPASQLYVVGLGERAVEQDDWCAAFDGVPSGVARVVLAHDPAALRGIPSGWAPLALAGHTHGGQIRAPFEPSWTPARLRLPWPQYADGWVRGFLRPGNHLFVNRGIGFSRLPIRFGAPPEVTFVTLRRLDRGRRVGRRGRR